MPLILMCKICSQSLEENELKCDCCCQSMHLRCSDLSPAEAEMLKSPETRALYFCGECYLKIPDPEMVKELREMAVNMEAEVEKLKKSTRLVTSNYEEASRPAAPREPSDTEQEFSRVSTLSPELAAYIGAPQMSRVEVAHKIWTLIKEKNLFDPKHPHYALCDDQLLKVIGRRRFRAMGILRYLEKHFLD